MTVELPWQQDLANFCASSGIWWATAGSWARWAVGPIHTGALQAFLGHVHLHLQEKLTFSWGWGWNLGVCLGAFPKPRGVFRLFEGG